MAQTMSVSVHLRLVDSLTQGARAAVRELQRLSQAGQQFNRALGGGGASNSFARMVNDVRALSGEVRNLVGQFNRLGRALTSSTTAGGFGQRQISDLQRMLQLQQQVIANNARMNLPAPGGGPRGGGPGGIWGRSGFNPNASLMDRLQFHGVNLGQRSLIEGALDLDRARTALQMLATPRPDPSNPGQLLPGVISPEAVAQAEVAAQQLSRIFPSLNRGHILDTFREIAPMFENIQDAFTLLPDLLNVQQWHVLMGDSVPQAREGMLRLMRAIGLSGRLINNNGRLSLSDPDDPNSSIAASEFLDTYLRARMIGGRDVSADQVFQVMKYLKASGQSLDLGALLTTFIAMPDIRGSTFGNQLNMMIRQLTGTSTQAAQQAAARLGLGTITERTASGPHGFQVVDEVMLRSNPFAWFARHIMGPQGVLVRSGLDPKTATQAQIATALRPIFSNQSAENIANMITGQWREWLGQANNAMRLNLSPEARAANTQNSLWTQLQSARSALIDAMGSAVMNFKVLLPVLQSVGEGLQKIASFIDPVIGNPAAGASLIGGGLVGAFMMLRRMAGMMGPWTRTLIGGGAGFLLGGGVGEALMGALLGRQMVGSAAAGAAGAAGAAAARSWGGRFLSVLRGLFMRAIPGMIATSVAIYAVTQIVEHWETVKTRLLAIWEDLRQAAPVWLGGQGQGWGAFAGSGSAMAQTTQDLDQYLQAQERSFQDWLRSSSLGQWLIRQGYAMTDSQMAYRRARQDLAGMGIDLDALQVDATARAAIPGTGGSTVAVTTGPINVTVNVTQSNASPQAIGQAAGNAVGSGLRGSLSDVGPMP
jgi:hypothetical protein